MLFLVLPGTRFGTNGGITGGLRCNIMPELLFVLIRHLNIDKKKNVCVQLIRKIY